MVRLYALDITNMPDPKDTPELLGSLSEKRKEKVLHCSTEKGRIEYAGAGLLLKEVLSRHHISEEEIRYGFNGKPECERLHFNLSHSEGMVICAVADAQVGCDIERVKEVNEKVINRFFGEKEKLHMKKTLSQNKAEEFFRIWTAKESYIKMTGEGMKVPFQSLDVSLAKMRIARDGVHQDCFLKEYNLPGYKITICSQESEFSQEIIFLDKT